MIAVGNKKGGNTTKTDGIIVIICLWYHCWGQIIVYTDFIWIKFLFGLMKKTRINEFTIGHMIHPNLNIKKIIKRTSG